MKIAVFSVVLVLTGSFFAGNGTNMALGAGGAVVEVDLSGEWDFAYVPEVGGIDAVGGERYKAKMKVPGCWDDVLDNEKAKGLWADVKFNPGYAPIPFPGVQSMPDASGNYMYGAGWYRRQIDVPAEWKGRQVVLYVGYVVTEAKVYVNGKEVCYHAGHCSNWEVNLSKELEYGKANEIQIMVNNVQSNYGGCRLRGWKGASAGIYDRVWLKVSGAGRVSDLYVYREGEHLRWEVDMEGAVGKGAKIGWRVIDPKTQKAAASGEQAVEGTEVGGVRWITDTLGLEAWSDRSPKLYEIEITLTAKGKEADVHRQAFGMRRLTADGRKLRLNGEIAYLRGVCEHAYFPETCTPPTDVESYRKILRRYKEIGYNWLRFHTWVPSEAYMQAADELGFMIQAESPSMGIPMEMWRDILKACRKHPCMVIYCGGNEARMTDDTQAILGDWAVEQKRLAPDGLFDPMSGDLVVTSGPDLELPDHGYGPERIFDPIEHNPVRLEKMKQYSDVYCVYAWGDLSHNTMVAGSEARFIDIRNRLYSGPAMSHETGILGAYMNFDLEKRYEGTRIGTDFYRHAREYVQQQGVFDRWRTYYKNSVLSQQLSMKDAVEMARQCRTLSGYNMLGAIDTQWHRSGYECGVLNEFGEFKEGVTGEDILMYNGESILMVSEQRQRTFFANEPFDRTILVSWYAEEDLEGGVLECRFATTDGTFVRERRLDVPRIARGSIAELAEIGFLLPDLTEGVKGVLEVKLSTPVRTIRNRWEYWVFPAVKEAVSSDVIVAHELKRETLEKLAGGAKVVLMGYKPFPVQAVELKQGKAGRPHHNFATIIEKHPLMDRFPHDGYCSWQFFGMMDMRDRGKAVQFNTLDVPFDPILEVASSYKNVRKQAAIFEVRVGKGALLVCSLNLWSSDPAAEYLRRIMLEYAASEQFAPRTEMKVEALENLIETAAGAGAKEKKSDAVTDKNVYFPAGSP